MAATKIKGLQQWCRRMTDGYANVDIANFTTSWRDGMAFCALIHRFRPDLIDYDALSPENVFENCKLAFEVAEKELDIPAFLEADDMAKLKSPDKLSVITYVSQYYNFLSPLPQLGGPGVKCKVSNKSVSGTKRRTDSDSSYAPTTKRAPVTDTKENATITAAGDICAICQKRVYLLERHTEDGKLYHRSCFRHSELSPTNKVYTRSPYMSPSLNSETPSFTYPSTNNSTSVLSEIGKGGKASNHQVATVAEASHVPKRSEGVGTKHALSDISRENTKKPRPQSDISFDEEKSKKASVIKDRLQHLKAQYSANKSSQGDSVLPLSGKETRKFERKREEILQSRKPLDEPVKSAKQSRPLNLHQHDKLISGTSKNDLSLSTATSASPAASLTVTAKLSAPTSTSSKVSTSKASNVSVSSKLDSQMTFSKNKLSSVKTSEKVIEDKLETNILKKKTLSDAPDPQKFPGKSGVNSKEPLKPTHPVAKPRTGILRSAGAGASEAAVSNRPALKSVAEHTNKEVTPKPVPRKSTMEAQEKTVSEQPKLPQRKKHTLHSDPVIDEVDSSRGPSASNPPPLPASIPPPLPASDPVGEITSLTDKEASKPSNELISQEAKTSHQDKTLTEDRKNVSLTILPREPYNKFYKSKTTVLDQINRFNTESTSSPGSVKSKIINGIAAVDGIKSPSCNRRWSSHISSTEHKQASNVAPAETNSEGQVAELPTSLSVVSGDSSSDPGSNDITLVRNNSSSDSVSNDITLLRDNSSSDPVSNDITLVRSSSSSDPGSNDITLFRGNSSSDSVSNDITLVRNNSSSDSVSNDITLVRGNSSSDSVSNDITLVRSNSSSDPGSNDITLVRGNSSSDPDSNDITLVRGNSSSDSDSNDITLVRGNSSSDPGSNDITLVRDNSSLDPGSNDITLVRDNSSSDSDSNDITLVRGNSSSDPGSNDITSAAVSSPPSLPPSLVPAPKPLSAHSTIMTETSFTPSPVTSATETSSASTPTSNKLSSLESVLNIITTSTEQISATDLNLTSLEKLNSNSAELFMSENVSMDSNEISKPRASSLTVICENSNKSIESKSLVNLTKIDTENILENLDRKSKSEENNFCYTQSEHIVSIDESKNKSFLEQSALSVVKEDLDFSLNHRATSDQKEVIEKPGTLASSTEANKDQINNESVPHKPPRLSKMSKTAGQKKHADLHTVGENDEKKKPHHKLEPSVSCVKTDEVVQALSSGSASEAQPDVVAEKADTTKELPQWKKDIEERKKKLREDIAKSESENVKLKHLREKGARKAPKNPDIVTQREDTPKSQTASYDAEPLTEKLISALSLENESANNNQIKNIDNKAISVSEINFDIQNLQQDSEKTKSSITGSDNGQEANYKIGDEPKRAVFNTSDNLNSSKMQKETIPHESEDPVQISDKTREHFKKSNNVYKNKATADRLIKKPAKLKDSELEFVVSRTKLKSVEVDIDISSTEESKTASNDQSDGKEDNDERDGDNKDFLQQVSRTEDVSMGITKTYNGTDFEHDITDVSASAAIKHLSDDNEKNNNKIPQTESSYEADVNVKGSGVLNSTDLDNLEMPKVNERENGRKYNGSNKSTLSESILASDTKHIQELNTKGSNLLETIDLRGSEEYKVGESEVKGNRRISVFSQEKLVLQSNKDNSEDKDKQTSPKVRRKITVLGRSNNDSTKSEPSSPLPMRKIEVSTKFNFEESSSDFEVSLSDSTAKLTLHKNEPPPRPPPPRSLHRMVPPLQISAIELQQQLLDIDSQLTDLELRGRDLEESIRSENTLEEDDDGVINEWFRLVSERNELVRKEADLVYISRQQDLEDEQEHIESQLRYLISKPDDCKSDQEKQEEVYLIKRKLELVEQRNMIVTSMDEDRMRYESEDRDIKMMREKGLWRHSSGQVVTVKETRVSKSVFYS